MSAENEYRWAQPLAHFIGTSPPSGDGADNWLIRDIVPRNQPWMLVGQPKCGKTWLALSLAAHVAAGFSWCGCAYTPRKASSALVVALEDGQQALKQRTWEVLSGMGTTPNDARIRDNLRVSDVSLRLPSDCGALLAESLRWKPSLVIIDSLTRVMEGDQNDASDARGFTSAWLELAHKIPASVCFLHHLNKPPPQAPHATGIGRIRGSTELAALPRHIVTMKRTGNRLSLTLDGNMDRDRDSISLEYARTTPENGTAAVTLNPVAPHDANPTTATTKPTKPSRDAAKRQAAMEIARGTGMVTAPLLAKHLGTSPPNANRLAPILSGLVSDGQLIETPDGFVPVAA